MIAPSRTGYDPFAPSAGIAFPERRLRRAGLSAEDLSRLSGEFDGMSAEQRRELVRFVTRNPDRRILTRFGGTYSRVELEGMTVARLEPLLRERGLSTDGRKAELVDRLLGSYGAAAAERPTQAPQEAATAPEPPAPAGVTPDASEGAQGEQEGQPGVVQTADGVQHVGTVPADAATQTPDATPAPDAAPAADTQEDSDRG